VRRDSQHALPQRRGPGWPAALGQRVHLMSRTAQLHGWGRSRGLSRVRQQPLNRPIYGHAISEPLSPTSVAKMKQDAALPYLSHTIATLAPPVSRRNPTRSRLRLRAAELAGPYAPPLSHRPTPQFAQALGPAVRWRRSTARCMRMEPSGSLLQRKCGAVTTEHQYGGKLHCGRGPVRKA